MFLASDVIKLHFGAHTENQESSSLPVAKHFLGLSCQKTLLVATVLITIKGYLFSLNNA